MSSHSKLILILQLCIDSSEYQIHLYNVFSSALTSEAKDKKLKIFQPPGFRISVLKGVAHLREKSWPLGIQLEQPGLETTFHLTQREGEMPVLLDICTFWYQFRQQFLWLEYHPLSLHVVCIERKKKKQNRQ